MNSEAFVKPAFKIFATPKKKKKLKINLISHSHLFRVMTFQALLDEN